MIRILLVAFCIGGLFFLLLRLLEPHLIFFPAKEMMVSPKEFGLSFEDVFFNTTGHRKLHGWFIPAGEARRTVFFCHGNAGNISYRIDKLIFFNRLGCNVFIFDYRGYGKSEGQPSEQGLYQDAQAAYDYLRLRGIPAEQIVGYGESIGGAAVVELASKHSMSAIILDSLFTNIKDMVKNHYPIIPHWILSSRFDSKMKIASIKIPKLIIQSDTDEIVPASLGAALFEAAAPPKEFLRIHGSHNEGFFESEKVIEEKFREFLSRF